MTPIKQHRTMAIFQEVLAIDVVYSTRFCPTIRVENMDKYTVIVPHI